MEKNFAELNYDDFDDYDSGEGRGGGGGGGKKKDKKQGDKTVREIASMTKANQMENRMFVGEGGRKTPDKDISDVIKDVLEMDGGDLEMKHLYSYIDWLKMNINAIDDLILSDKEISKMEAMTAHLGAGGGGKDTSNNARAATHLITGIRIRSQDDRKAEGNIQSVKLKMLNELKRHLQSWKVVMESLQTPKEREDRKPFDLNKVGDEVLKRATS